MCSGVVCWLGVYLLKVLIASVCLLVLLAIKIGLVFRIRIMRGKGFPTASGGVVTEPTDTITNSNWRRSSPRLKAGGSVRGGF